MSTSGERPDEADPVERKAGEMGGRRLLIIDDEPAFAAFVERVARDLGFAAYATTSAQAFETLFVEFAPTHVVLDMVMPERDGIEFVRWLAARRFDGRIIVITGFNPGYAAAAALYGQLEGTHPVVTLRKPVSLADLRAALSAS